MLFAIYKPFRTEGMNIIAKYYPRARDNRIPFSYPSLKAIRPKFFKVATLNFLIFQLLFFALFCYLLGALYRQGPSTHSMKLVWVDYDGGIIGEAVRNAYESLWSHSFPTLTEMSPS